MVFCGYATVLPPCIVGSGHHAAIGGDMNDTPGEGGGLFVLAVGHDLEVAAEAFVVARDAVDLSAHLEDRDDDEEVALDWMVIEAEAIFGSRRGGMVPEMPVDSGLGLSRVGPAAHGIALAEAGNALLAEAGQPGLLLQQIIELRFAFAQVLRRQGEAGRVRERDGGRGRIGLSSSLVRCFLFHEPRRETGDSPSPDPRTTAPCRGDLEGQVLSC